MAAPNSGVPATSLAPGSLEQLLAQGYTVSGGVVYAPGVTPPPDGSSSGKMYVDGKWMSLEEYTAWMAEQAAVPGRVQGGAADSAARAREAELAAQQGGIPTAVVAPGSAADQAGAGAPDIPNGGPGSPGYDNSTRPEDGLNGFRDYDNNGIDDRTQNYVGSGVFDNPGAIQAGAPGTSPVGGWGNAINTGVGGPVDLGGGGGGGLSLGGYGDLGGYPGGGGAAGPASGGNFTAPGADGGGFTAPPAPSFQFPDVSTIGGGATGATGGTGTGGFTMPEFQNPLAATGGATGGGSSTTGGGSTGGTGVAATTGGGTGGSTPLVGQLAGSYQSAIDSANAANENRFGTGLELLLKRAEQAGMATQGLTYEGMNDIGRMFGQNRARSDQDLINRGLANTTVREGVMRGYATDEQAARNRYADDQTRKNIDENFRQQQGLVDWLGARNDVGPDVGQLANLASGVGAAGPAATTPTTTTPSTTTPAASTTPAPLPGNTAATAPQPSSSASTGGAFTKSSAPNPTISQPAASPQTAQSLSGYGQSATASSPAAPTAQQTANVQNMFSGAADSFRASADGYATSQQNTAANKAQLAANAGPISMGNQNAFAVANQQRAASDAAMSAQQSAPMPYDAVSQNVTRSLADFHGLKPGTPGYDAAYSTAMKGFGFDQPQSPSQTPAFGGGGQDTLSNTTGSNGTPTPPPPGMPPVQNLVGANPLTMPDSTPFFGGGGQSMLSSGIGSNGRPTPPPPGMMPQAPAGPSLMGYPDASPQGQQMMSQARDMAMLLAPPPSAGSRTPWGVGQTFETGGASPKMMTSPSPTTQQPAAPATQGAAPVSAMASGMPALPSSPQSYSPPPMPQGMGQVPTNQVYMGVNGIPVYTDPNGQRKPANYYPSLNQYGVMA